MQLKDPNKLAENPNASARMPVLFVGHGSPMTLKGKNTVKCTKCDYVGEPIVRITASNFY